MLVTNHDFYTPLHSTPPLGGPRRNIAIPFGMEKLEWWCTWWWKNFKDTCNCLHTTPVCDGQTETSCHGILRAMHMHRAVKTNVETLLGLMLNEKSARWKTLMSLLVQSYNIFGHCIMSCVVYILQVKFLLKCRLKLMVMISLSIHMMTSQDHMCVQCVTDGRTDRDILPRHSPRYAYASRDKNQCRNLVGINVEGKVS